MNKRIKELAVQADLFWSERDGRWHLYDDSKDLERFAELVRQDLYQVVGKNIIEQINSAIQMEREACAKLCDDLQLTDLCIRDWADGTYDCAKAIRARGEPSPAFKNYMDDNWAGIV